MNKDYYQKYLKYKKLYNSLKYGGEDYLNVKDNWSNSPQRGGLFNKKLEYNIKEQSKLVVDKLEKAKIAEQKSPLEYDKNEMLSIYDKLIELEKKFVILYITKIVLHKKQKEEAIKTEIKGLIQRMEQIKKGRTVEKQLNKNIYELKDNKSFQESSEMLYKKKEVLNIYNELIDLETERLKNRQLDYNIKKETALKTELKNLLTIRENRYKKNLPIEDEIKKINKLKKVIGDDGIVYKNHEEKLIYEQLIDLLTKKINSPVSNLDIKDEEKKLNDSLIPIYKVKTDIRNRRKISYQEQNLLNKKIDDAKSTLSKYNRLNLGKVSNKVSELVVVYEDLIKLKKKEWASINRNEQPDAAITKENSELQKKEEDLFKIIDNIDIIQKTIDAVSSFHLYITEYKGEKDYLGLGEDVIEKLDTLDKRLYDYETLLIRKRNFYINKYTASPQEKNTYNLMSTTKISDLETKISDLYKELSEIHREIIEIIIKYMLIKKSSLNTEQSDFIDKNIINKVFLKKYFEYDKYHVIISKIQSKMDEYVQHIYTATETLNNHKRSKKYTVKDPSDEIKWDDKNATLTNQLNKYTLEKTELESYYNSVKSIDKAKWNNQITAHKTYKKLKAELSKLSDNIAKTRDVNFEKIIKEPHII